MNINDFELYDFLKPGEDYVKGDVMLERAGKNIAAKEDVDWLLKHQNEIPKEWRRFYLLTNWRHPDSPENVCCVYWGDGRWVADWGWLGVDWYGLCRVLRRVSSVTKTLGTSDKSLGSLEARVLELENWKKDVQGALSKVCKQ